MKRLVLILMLLISIVNFGAAHTYDAEAMRRRMYELSDSLDEYEANKRAEKASSGEIYSDRLISRRF